MPGRQFALVTAFEKRFGHHYRAAQGYHKASDSTLLNISAHNVYYVKYNLVFDGCLVHTP